MQTPQRTLAAEIEHAEADGNRRLTEHQRLADADYAGDFLSLDGAGALFCFPGPDMNYVSGLGFDQRPDLSLTFDQIDAFYRTRQSLWTIDVSSLADPEIVGLASQRGYRPGPSAHMWGKRLGGLDSPPSAIPFQIVEVGPDASHKWAHTAARGFGDGIAEPAAEQIDSARLCTRPWNASLCRFC